jgi:two-component system, OmpR family, response regulator RegX3
MVGVDESIKVLVVEDEESYRQALASGLGREGFIVEVAADGVEALRLFAEDPPHIVLLDMLLPGMHGIEVCRRMRRLAPVPIVMVSAVDSELDVVLGLELGAAGYVTKPFRLRELVARMQAILRRVSPPDVPPFEIGPSEPEPVPEFPNDEERPDVAFGSVVVDFVRREVTVGGVRTHLSRREFDLLSVLLTPVRRVRTRDELIDLLWPDRFLSDSRTLDTHIHRLRAKLEPDPADPRFIVTVRGVGFRIEPDGDDPVPPAHTGPGPDPSMGSKGPEGPSGRTQPLTA